MMENYILYIGKSALAAGTFYLCYMTLFQNRKQFAFNRIYLPASLALSFVIPLITFTQTRYIEVASIASNNVVLLPENIQIHSQSEFQPEWFHYLFVIYILGLSGFVFYLMLGYSKAVSIIKSSRSKIIFSLKVNITKKDVHPFSFFKKIVIPEKTLENPNLKMILDHEHIHVKEKHSFDIIISEMLFLLQWFNPFAWLIKNAIKNNLEYKTDEQIAEIHNPKAYQLAIVGLPDKKRIAPFLNALNGSELKNRIIMMNKKTDNKYALAKKSIVIPLVAFLVMGLSNRELETEIIHRVVQKEIISSEKIIKGKVTDEKDDPLSRVAVIIKNKQVGTITDNNGNYEIKVEDQDKLLIFNYLNIDKKEIPIQNRKKVNVQLNTNKKNSYKENDHLSGNSYMKQEALAQQNIKPALPNYTANKQSPNTKKTLNHVDNDSIKELVRVKSDNISGEPIIFIDGEKFDGNLNDINPDNIKNVEVLKDRFSTMFYGNKGKNGVILIQTESGDKPNNDYKIKNIQDLIYQRRQIDPGVVIMPEFPGGQSALDEFIAENIEYPPSPYENGIWGTVIVNFIISKTGKVTDVKLDRGVDPALDEEALRIVGLLPDWKPGTLNGKPVEVSYTVPVNFVLPESAVARWSLKGMPPLKGYLYIVNGKEKDNIDNISFENILDIELLKGKDATARYGKKGRNGVLVITTRNNFESDKITTEYGLRKFIADKIKYPVAAQKAKKEGTVQLFIRTNYNGKVSQISDKAYGNEMYMGEVVVVGYSTDVKRQNRNINKDDTTKDESIEDNNELLKEEVRRIINMFPKIEIADFKGKTVGIKVKFLLQ